MVPDAPGSAFRLAAEPAHRHQHHAGLAIPDVHRLGNRVIQFYNDGYRPILGSSKHPQALGISTKQTFAEIWNIIGSMFEQVMEGTATGYEDFLLPMERHGFAEECYFTFSYSPIREEGGRVGGVLVTVSETTKRVLGERRLQSLKEMASATAKPETPLDACVAAMTVLEKNIADVPFAALYTLHDSRPEAQLAAQTRMESAAPCARSRQRWDSERHGHWPRSWNPDR